MIRRREPTSEPQVDNDLRSPRISWSVLVMGAGVIASIVLNYAAYDTRITVLERAKLADEKSITQLQTETSSLRKEVYDLKIDLTALTGGVKHNRDAIDRNKMYIRDIDVEVDKLKDKVKAP